MKPGTIHVMSTLLPQQLRELQGTLTEQDARFPGAKFRARVEAAFVVGVHVWSQISRTVVKADVFRGSTHRTALPTTISSM